MKLIVEHSTDVQVIKEGSGDGRKHHIVGVFMQAECKNRNGRLYPRRILEREVNRYAREFIKESRALGELSHPANCDINLDRVSHLITDLHFEGNNVLGKAKVLDTPCGKIIKNLVDEGVKLGVSSRGMGSLVEADGASMVDDDYYLATIDSVFDPSAPEAFVNGVMEGREFFVEGSLIKSRSVDQLQERIKSIRRTCRGKVAEAAFATLFERYMRKLATTKY